VSRETERKRAEAQAARERLVGTVNELGSAVQDAKRRAKQRAQAVAPFVLGSVGLITVLKVLRRKR
jgi:hypothetical protein